MDWKIRILFSLILIFLTGCFPPKKTSELGKKTVFDDPRFFYDKEDYTLIRVNPETREEDINLYMSWKSEKFLSDSQEIQSFNDPNTPPPVRKFVKPYYPKEAKERGYQPTIILLLKVDSTGIVELARLVDYIVKGAVVERKLEIVEESLVESSLEAAIQFEFIPQYFEFPISYNEEGKIEPVFISFPIRFVLH